MFHTFWYGSTEKCRCDETQDKLSFKLRCAGVWTWRVTLGRGLFISGSLSSLQGRQNKNECSRIPQHPQRHKPRNPLCCWCFKSRWLVTDCLNLPFCKEKSKPGRMSLYQSQNQLVTRILFLLQSSCYQVCGGKYIFLKSTTCWHRNACVHSR